MYFEAVIKRNDENKGKEVTERFIVVNAERFSEVETALLEVFNSECVVNAIKQSKLKEIVNSRVNEDDEIFYATLESYYMSESGEEKASKSEVAVFATNMTDAKTKLDAYMKQGLDDMAIVKIAKTKFLDLIEI